MKRFILVGFQLFAVTTGFLCLTVGCTTGGGTGATPTHTYIVPVTSEPDPLNGTRWELVAFESEARTPSIPEQPRLFIAFNIGELSLQGGCNVVSGHYRIENNRITITFVEATQVDCSDSMPGINEIEDAFSNAMPTFESYMIEGDQLRIRYADGELLFRRVSD
ncbi:MAG: META domain protein [Chloroflexi bacterium ADurb.Bin360]|nr:MAG: META domain protein [Chloroflexi bacterium ADurb.Bin360]QLQ06537.1 MAG: META domain-containing protein [Anaerolineae bacterium]